MSVRWTSDQADAITRRGMDLLVSASAGAGKTAVMTERIASMIENNEIPASELLVLTFTNAAAKEMRAKLIRRLSSKHNLDSAFIGTFHKFCSELNKTYFTVASVSPDFEILDEPEAAVLKSEAADNAIAKNYVKLKHLIDTFTVNRKTDALKNQLMEIYEFVCTRENPDKWLSDTALASYDTNIALKNIIGYYSQIGIQYCQIFLKIKDAICVNSSAKELSYLEECIRMAESVAAVKSYDCLYKIAKTAAFSRLKPGLDENFKNIREGFKSLIGRITEHYSLELSLIIKNQLRDRSLVVDMISLVKMFEGEYLKAKQGRLDFNDLEKYACLVLENLEAVQNIRQKYKYIFIDEYQDTNPIQEKILTEIGCESSMFMVGDVKQSIYGFRGCEAAIFADKMQREKVVKLNKNFRSKSNILQFANHVFGKIMKNDIAEIDYSKTSAFNIDQSAVSANSTQVAVKLVNSSSGTAPELQAALIAKKIAALNKSGVALRDIAILARSRTHFNQLLSVLRRADIAFFVDAESYGSELFEISLLNNMLFAVSNFYNDAPLILLMSGFVFGFTPDELAAIKISGRAQNDSAEEQPFYKKLLSYIKNENLNEIKPLPLAQKIQKFLEFLEKYRALAKSHNTADVLTIFLTEYKIIDKLSILPEGSVMAANIRAYLENLRGKSAAATVSGYLYLLENKLLDIKIRPPASDSDCVQIMTIHSSKGLEFPIVFVYDAGAPFNISDARRLMLADKKFGLCVYSLDADEFTKTHSIARLSAVISNERTNIAEEMRLLYVALTRAKNQLIIIGGGNIDKLKSDNAAMTEFAAQDEETSPMMIMRAKNYLQLLAPGLFKEDDCFTLEIIDAEAIQVTDKTPEKRILTGEYDKEFTESLEKLYSMPYRYKTDMPSKTSVTELTQKKQISARLDSEKPASFVGKEHGTQVHKKMQFTGDDELYKLFPMIKGWKIYRELPFLQSVCLAEGVCSGDTTIVQGVIDLLAINGKEAVIIDYKTNNISEQRMIELYSAQLNMYKAAVAQALNNITPKIYIYSIAREKLIEIK